MSPLVVDEIGCFNGGVEGFIRGGIGGTVVGFIFWSPKNRAQQKFQFLKNFTPRLKMGGKFGLALSSWNCMFR
jgi:hypothetical protein